MNNWKKHREIAEDLTAHGSYRGNCPFCGGKNTYTASKNNGTLMWNCYKLGCTASGMHNVDMTASDILRLMNQTVKLKERQDIPTMDIPVYVVKPTSFHDLFQRFTKSYQLNTDDLLYDVKDQRVVFPIYHEGRIIDAIGRAVGKKTFPKWYRYTGNASYYTCGNGNNLLIVEDVISARVALNEIPHITSMAILGTQLTDKHIEKIQDYHKVVIALDPDAQSKTIKYRRYIEDWTGLPTVAFKLVDDVKYRMQEDLDRLKELLS